MTLTSLLSCRCLMSPVLIHLIPISTLPELRRTSQSLSQVMGCVGAGWHLKLSGSGALEGSLDTPAFAGALAATLNTPELNLSLSRWTNTTQLVCSTTKTMNVCLSWRMRGHSHLIYLSTVESLLGDTSSPSFSVCPTQSQFTSVCLNPQISYFLHVSAAECSCE